MRPYFIHIRQQVDQPISPDGILLPPVAATKGGMTLAVVGDPDHGFRYGVAKCSKQDNYEKSKGRALAAGRAFEKKTSLSLPDDLSTMRDVEQYLRHHYTV